MALIEVADVIPDEVVTTLLKVRRTLLQQPLKHLHNVPGGSVGIFSLFLRGLPPGASYEECRTKALLKEARPSGHTWTELLASEPADLVLSARSYDEISDLRFWLRDAINLRWARECGSYAGPAVPLEAFEFVEPSRDAEIVRSVKRLYTGLGLKTCLYSGETLPKNWELDHFLPWSRFPVDIFWNLVPAHPSMNRGPGGKFDLLPRLALVRPNYEKLLGRVLTSSHPLVAEHLRITWRRYFQEPTVGAEDAAARIWSVVETSWQRLAKAGVRVWVAGEAA